MSWMLRLYPRAWRRRYGAEVAALVAAEDRSFRLFLDLLAGAIDARLDPQPTPSQATSSEETPMRSLFPLCTAPAFTAAEMKRSAAWMIGSSLGFVLVGLGLQLFFGRTIFSFTVICAAFPMALILSGQSTYLKRHSRAARTVILGLALIAMFGFFLAVTYIANYM